MKCACILQLHVQLLQLLDENKLTQDIFVTNYLTV